MLSLYHIKRILMLLNYFLCNSYCLFFFFFLFFTTFFFFFFFSSRRRHTRSLRDWSSDVCSSDLVALLPRVNPYAAQLSVTEQTDQFVKARVMLEDSIFTDDYTTYILGISKDSLCFAGVGRGMYELNIPVLNFPAGIATLLLFNAKKQLVSERSIYINRKDYNINISTDKESYAARENVKMNINITDPAGKPLMAALAVSVIDGRISDTTD